VAGSLHVVFGCNGPVGTELVHRLHAAGERVRGVSRSGRATAPAGVEIVAGDASDRVAARRACQGAAIVHCCVGVDYTRWAELWPPIIDGLLDGAASAGARLVFADNLYSYGPHDGPLTEDLPVTAYGRKPALRARMTEQLLAADRAGRVRVALVRASDFYGPRALNSMLGERVFPNALAGTPALLMGDVDQPHTYSYVPDVARALATVAAADDAFGQIWHVPSAPARTTREVVASIYRLAGREPRLRAIPFWLQRALGAFVPVVRELAEMKFIWDRPYVVDHSKFAARFWDDYTPLADGLATTLDWYRSAARP
jgi:nucleoside-diphosphate-sugar epimerase